MDYVSIYINLIKKAESTYPFGNVERHHIIPRSLGGTNTIDNLVYLTLKQHHFAHLLLFKIFEKNYPNQIFAIEAFYNNSRFQSIDIHKMPKWVRRKIWVRKQELIRESKKSPLMGLRC